MSKIKESTALTPVVDGLEGYTNTVDGEENRQQGLLRGVVLKFGDTAVWERRDDSEVVDADARFVLTDIKRVVVRWKDKKPAETIILGPGEPIPNLSKWNDQLPKTEWVPGPTGELKGPWQFQNVVYLLDPSSMTTYSWPTSTIGGGIAIEHVVDAVKAMRRFRPGACPVVQLSSAYMKTRFGGKQRPHLQVHSWIGGAPDAEPSTPALPVPEAPPTAPATPATAKANPKGQQPKSFALGERVKPVSMSEELNDEVPFLG